MNFSSGNCKDSSFFCFYKILYTLGATQKQTSALKGSILRYSNFIKALKSLTHCSNEIIHVTFKKEIIFLTFFIIDMNILLISH